MFILRPGSALSDGIDRFMMRLSDKNQIILALVAWSLLIGSLIYIFHLDNEENKLLEENPVRCSALVVETYYFKGHNIRYEYVVNGKVYQSTKNYYENRQFIYVGDTCEIIYVESDPEISRVLEDDHDLLRIKHRK